jgi:hypothetical protein
MGAEEATPPLRIYVKGPVAEAGRLPIDDLNLLSRGLQSVVQAVAVQVTSDHPTERRAKTAVRRAARLALVAVRPGSVSVDFEFTVASTERWVEDVRRAAVTDVITGIRELAEHMYLPTAWSPDALKGLRRLVGLLDRGFDQLVISSPLYVEVEAQIDREIEPRLTLMLERYEALLGPYEVRRERSEGVYSYDLLVPRVAMRRRTPRLPLFESGRPDLAKELEDSFGGAGDA